MTAIVILNVVFATSIVAAILSLLGWGIVSDKAATAAHSARLRSAARARPARSGSRQPARVLDVSA